MPRIPLVTNDVAAKTRGLDGYASASSFGGAAAGLMDQIAGTERQVARTQTETNLGMLRVQAEDAATRTQAVMQGARAMSREAAGMEQFGSSLQAFGSSVDKLAETRRALVADQQTASGVASFDYTQRNLERQTAAPPGAKGFTAETKNDYDKAVDDHLNTMSDIDPLARRAVRQQLMARKPGVVSSAAQFENNSEVNLSKTRADDALAVIENKVRADPSSWQTSVLDGENVINSRHELPANLRETMKLQFRASIAKRRFESMISSANTPEGLDGIEKELSDPKQPWQNEMAPGDYDRMLDGVKTAKKSVQTLADTQARAALDGLKARDADAVVIDPQSLADIERMVRTSKSPTLQWEFAELRERQDIYRRYPGLTPGQYREKITQMRGLAAPGSGEPNIPPLIDSAISRASTATGINASYLAGTFQREANAAKVAAGDYGFGTDVPGASSAVGVFQFTRDTWLNTVKGGNGINARLMGVDLTGKSDAQLLELRKDPVIASMGAALLAKGNKAAMEGALGRGITDGELYMAHFLGAPEAIRMLNLARDKPDASAAAAFPAAAEANKGIFYAQDGTPLNLSQVVTRLTTAHGSSPTRISYVRSEAMQKLADKQQTALKDDMVSYAAASGRFSVSKLDTPEGWAQRGTQALAMADYYTLPQTDIKPFTKSETEQFTKVIKEGSSEDVLGLMTQIQKMGPVAARAAYKQLGETDSVFEFAAGLAFDRNSENTASEIVKGQKRLNPNGTMDADARAALGKHDDVREEFMKYMGKALTSVEPRVQKQVFDAAVAHYAEAHIGSGGGKYGVFDKSAFQNSIDAVLGGSKATPAIGSINGEPTILPPGIDARMMDRAVDRITTADLLKLSVDGAPPRYADGSIITPEEIAREARFRSIGANQYRLQMADNRWAVTKVDPRTGAASLYILKADPAAIREIAQREVPAQVEETYRPSKPAMSYPNPFGGMFR